MLEAETLRLVNLVDDLQQLSKAEAAEAFLKRQEIQLSTFLDQLLTLFDLRFQAKRISVAVDIDPIDISFQADQDKLLQTFRNLLENALCYTPVQGNVRIDARQLENVVDISIANTGAGIAAEELPFIFERFFRADRSRSREQGGPESVWPSSNRWLKPMVARSKPRVPMAGPASVCACRSDSRSLHLYLIFKLL